MRDSARPFAMVNDSPVRPESREPDLVGVLEERVAALVEQRRDSLKVIEELRTRLAERDTELRRVSTELAEHGYAISPGTLYPTLHRMEEGGLLASRGVVVAGRRRRVYRTTAAGDSALAAMRAALSELADEVLGVRAARRAPH